MQKVTLKQSTKEDAEFFYEMMQNKEYQKYYLDRLLLKTVEEAEKYIQECQRESKKSKMFCFTIYYGKEKAGIIDLYKINSKDKRGSIGYGIKKEYWGKGIATQAIKQGLEFMKEKLKLHSCEATTDPKNKASKKVLEKNGFEKIGIAKDYYYQNGKYVDRALYWKIL
jgi:ribosomal-protein-alanine N-acetyltransferase